MVHLSQPLGLLLVVMQLSNFAECQSDGTYLTTESNSDDGYPDETTTTSSIANSEKQESITERNNGSATALPTNDTSNVTSNKPTELTSSLCCNNKNGTNTSVCQQNESTVGLKFMTEYGTEREDPTGYLKQYDECKDCQPLSLSLEVHWSFLHYDKWEKYNKCCKKETAPNNSVTNETCGPFPENDRTYYYENVPMIKSCLSTYTDEVIKNYCTNKNSNDLTHDLWLMTPVTDRKDNVTHIYNNVFCAACNERPLDNIKFWELLLVCYEKQAGKNFKLQTNEEQKDDQVFTKLFPKTTGRIGFWRYFYSHENEEPEDLFCFVHPRIESEKSKDSRCLEYGAGNSSMLNDTNYKASPERNCSASCRSLGNEKKQCTSSKSAIIFSLTNPNESSPRFSGCDDKNLILNKSLHDILCKGPDDKTKCKLKSVDCVIAKYYPVTSVPTDFADYENYNISAKHTFVCGPKVADSISSWVDKLLKMLLFLLRSAVIGLIFHLLIFAWLPAKSTSDKNLGCFGFALLVQNLCAIYDRQKGIFHCRIIASIWHYSMLSSFTWVLLLSYDCWLNLRQIFQLYDLIGEYDPMQFLIYFVISQIIPLIVTSTAIIWGSSSADWYCQRDLGLDRYECLLSEVPGFTPFFIISALFLFTLNIYFLVRVGCLVFSRELYLKEVRQKFNDRSGFALMMSPTWMLGSLLILTHFELPVCDILIITVHVLQSVFFLANAFSQWLGRIMQKYEEIERQLFGEGVFFPMSTSVMVTEDRQVMGILEGRQLERSENENLYS